MDDTHPEEVGFGDVEPRVEEWAFTYYESYHPEKCRGTDEFEMWPSLNTPFRDPVTVLRNGKIVNSPARSKLPESFHELPNAEDIKLWKSAVSRNNHRNDVYVDEDDWHDVYVDENGNFLGFVQPPEIFLNHPDLKGKRLAYRRRTGVASSIHDYRDISV